MRSDIIAKAVEGSIKKIYLKKLRLDIGVYEWDESRGIIRNYVLTMFCLVFKSIHPATRIGVSNLNDDIVKRNLANFGNNVKYFLDEMP